MRIRPFGQGIGVRAAPNPLCLWFHLEDKGEISAKLRENGGGFADTAITGITRQGPNLKVPRGSRSLDHLTPRGQQVFAKVLNLEGVAAIDARPNYFCVDLNAPKRDAVTAWTSLLPRIIAIIRSDLEMPTLPVYAITRDDITGADWHTEMIQRIFPSS